MELCIGMQALYRPSLNTKVRGLAQNISDHGDLVKSPCPLSTPSCFLFFGICCRVIHGQHNLPSLAVPDLCSGGTWPKLGHTFTSQGELAFQQREQIDLSQSNCVSVYKSLEVLATVLEDLEAEKINLL